MCEFCEGNEPLTCAYCGRDVCLDYAIEEPDAVYWYDCEYYAVCAECGREVDPLEDDEYPRDVARWVEEQ